MAERQQLVAVLASTRGTGTCRSCGAAITWYRTHPANKAIPFDGAPVAIRTSHTADTHELVEHVDAADDHFRSCPDAANWRRA